MTSSAWPLARRGRCGPCIALMTKKVEEGRRRHAGFMQWRASSAPRRALSFLLALRFHEALLYAVYAIRTLAAAGAARGASSSGAALLCLQS